MSDAHKNNNTTEASMDTIIERYEEIMRTGEAKTSQDAVRILRREGVSFGDACKAIDKAFGGKPARRTRGSITTRAW